MPDEVDPPVQTVQVPETTTTDDVDVPDSPQVNEGAERLLSEIFGSITERLSGSEPTAVLSSTTQYYERPSMPTDRDRPGSERPRPGMTFGVNRTDDGNVNVDIFVGSRESAQNGTQPAGRMVVSYSEEDGRRTERRALYDLTSAEPILAGSTAVTFDQATGELILAKSTGNRGHRLTLLNGRPRELQILSNSNERNDAMTFSFENGQIASVKLNGVELTAEQRLNFIRAAESTIRDVLRDNDLPTDGFRSAIPSANPMDVLQRMGEAVGDDESWDTLEDGTLVRRYQGMDGERETHHRSDGATVHYKNVDGDLQVEQEILADGTSIARLYSDDNRINTVLAMRPDGSLAFTYSTDDGGTSWTRSPGGQVGTLEFRDGQLPNFQVAQAQAVQPVAPDSVTPSQTTSAETTPVAPGGPGGPAGPAPETQPQGSEPESGEDGPEYATSFEEVEGDDAHRAPEAARNGEGQLMDGTFDGPDGSRIEYARAADGTIRPRSIRYRDGSSSEFTYNDAGAVTTVVNKNPQGTVRSRFVSDNGGTTYVMEAGGNRSPAMQGTMTIRGDGTMHFAVRGAQAAQNQTFETTSQGELIRNYRAGDGPRESRFRLNGSEVHHRINGENRLLVLEVLPDQVRIDRIYGADNRISAVVVARTDRPLGTYTTTDGGTTWTELPGNRRGTLTLEQGRLPVFRPADAPAQPQEVQETPPSNDRPVTAQERTRFLQERVMTMLETIYQPRFQAANQRILDAAREARRDLNNADVRRAIQGELEQAHRDITAEMQRDRQALEREIQAMRTSDNPDATWRNSPVTQRLYRDLVRWLEREAIPATMRQLAGAHAREIPAGSPQAVPQHQGVFLIPELFRQQAASGTLPQPDFRIPGTRDGDGNQLRVPTEADLSSLGRGLDWLVTARRQMDRSRLDYELNSLLPGIIASNRLPGGWLREVGENPESRREAMRQMIELATTIRNYSNAIVALRLDQTNVAQLPPGHHARITGAGNGRRLEALNLDLPQSLDMQDPNNLRRIEELQLWLRENRPAVDAALREWERSLDPSRQLFYGEIETRGVVLRDEQGRPQRILDPNNPEHRAIIQHPQNAGRTSEFNNLSCGFTVSRQADGIYLEYNTQPQESHWYNYLNIGATDVGRPFTDRRGPFQPGDPVAIRDGSGQLHMVRAEDLDNWLAEQKFNYWGSKALTVTMDVGMLVAGLATGFTATAAYQAG
ncbi:MAG: hypothetical protein K2Z81_12300, partial [Cyanobacteria bacterium]|nr:hypothetical protein [Cyanobacteriota bacterium]